MLFKRVFSYIEQQYRQRAIVLCILVAVIVFAIDYITGESIQFPILYVLPVGMAAWQDKKNTAYTLAILLPLLRVGFHFPWHETDSLSMIALNASIRILILIFYAYLVDRIVLQKMALEKEVRILEGILPICAWCKRIRNEKGEYEQIEEYITHRTEASFSHGICQECAKKMFSEYLVSGQDN